MNTRAVAPDVGLPAGRLGAGGVPVWRSDYRTLRDFRAFELVNALRLPLTLDGFRVVATLGSIAAIALGTLVFFPVMTALRDGPLRDHTTAVLNWGFLGLLYAAAAIVLAEIISSRRLAVSGCPHLELFRAMELPLHQVVIRYGVIPALRRILLLWYASGLFLVIFFEASANYVSVVVASIAVLLFVSGASVFSVLKFASVPARRIGLRWRYCLIALALGLVLGSATGFLAPRVAPFGGIDLDSSRFLPTLAVCAAMASGLLFLLSVRTWRRLSYFGVSLGVAPTVPGSRLPTAGPGRFVLSDMLSSKQGSVVSTIVLAWISVVGLLLGASNLLPVHPNLGDAELHRSLIGLSVLLSLAVTEPMLHRIGPTAKLYHYRFAWENGVPAAAIVARLMGIYLLMGAMIGGFVLLAAFLALGVPAPGAVFAGVIVAAAGIVAESLSRPPATTDGTKSNDVLDALLTLLLISPCSFVLVLSPQFSTLVLSGYSVFLTLGAAACLRQRLLSLRSRLTL